MSEPRQEILHMHANYALLSKLREFVHEAGGRVGLDAKERESLVLAIDEAATNIITHAVKKSSEEFDCCCWLDQESRSVICELVYDAEDLFAPGEAPTEESIRKRVTEFKRGGYGVYLMHSLVDTIEYRREGKKNVIRLVKKHQEEKR